MLTQTHTRVLVLKPLSRFWKDDKAWRIQCSGHQASFGPSSTGLTFSTRVPDQHLSDSCIKIKTPAEPGLQIFKAVVRCKETELAIG